MTDKEAIKLALEALEYIRNIETDVDSQTKYGSAVETLEEALAKQEQGEPYAYEIQEGDSFTLVYSEAVHKYKTVSEDSIVATLYTTPQQRTWVGLTDEEIDTWNIVGHESLREFVRAIEAKLKEKNT